MILLGSVVSRWPINNDAFYLYLLDGMYNNDDRLGGSQATQVRMVLDNIDEYQVLTNQYSAEFGGGAGALDAVSVDTNGVIEGLNDILELTIPVDDG